MILTYECHPQYNIYIFSTALTHSLAHECMRERTSYCQLKNIMFVNDIDDYMFGFSNMSRYTLLKIIKGTRVMNGITDLPYILHSMHDMCLID